MPHLLLIISGGVAACKSLALLRLWRERGYRVSTILTRAGAAFVTPAAVRALGGDGAVYTEQYLENGDYIDHVALAREVDAIVAAPATAHLLARMAHGLADDLATTTLLVAEVPVLIAPAMNESMWEHPATRRNRALLEADGVRFVGPENGIFACGESGTGRMAEPEAVAEALEALLEEEKREKPLAGLQVLVTSGPTYEPVDPVRFLGNRSSGKQGHAIAAACARAGAHVTLVSGPVALPDPPGCRVIRVETAGQMEAAVRRALPTDVAVCAAAVADWTPATPSAEKIRKSDNAGTGNPLPDDWRETPDILRYLAREADPRPGLVIGFAAETVAGEAELAERAAAKRARKGCDWLLANPITPDAPVFGAEDTTLHCTDENGGISWGRLSKQAVAGRLVARIAEWRKEH